MDFSADARGRQRIISLLLLYLFVARTLGDCPKPILGENIVLTNEALLMNTFPDNIEISLECPNGYVIDTGSGIMKCTDGAWGKPDLTCRKKDCGPPPPKAYMTFDLSQGTLFGAVAVIKCDKGYFVQGSAYKHCYNAGWTGKTSKCEIVTCNKPDDVVNGRNNQTSNDPQYGEYIQYYCDEGYTLIGNDVIMCTENGEYDSTPPRCQGVTKADAFTTQMVTTPPSTPPSQEPSTVSDTTTVHRLTTLTASATPTPTVSLSARGAESWTSEDNSTSPITSTVASHFQEEPHEDVIVADNGYTPVIISVVCVSIVVCIVVLFIHKLLLKRKGSPNGTAPIC